MCSIIFNLFLIVKPTRPPPTTTSTSKPTSSLVTHCTSKHIISLVYIYIVPNKYLKYSNLKKHFDFFRRLLSMV